MKTAIIIADGIKQIMFTPENDSEKAALKLITSDQDISVDFKMGNFYSVVPPSAYGYYIAPCQGGYLRAYEDSDSLMLVLRPKSLINKCEDNAKQNEVD